MNLQHLHENSQSINNTGALELTRGAHRLSTRRLCLYLLVSFAAGLWSCSWLVAIITR